MISEQLGHLAEYVLVRRLDDWRTPSVHRLAGHSCHA